MLPSHILLVVTPEMESQFVIAIISKHDKSDKQYIQAGQGRLGLWETLALAQHQLVCFDATAGDSRSYWDKEKNLFVRSPVPLHHEYSIEPLSSLPEETLKKYRMTRISNE